MLISGVWSGVKFAYDAYLETRAWIFGARLCNDFFYWTNCGGGDANSSWLWSTF